jgi:hypothetical protein
MTTAMSNPHFPLVVETRQESDGALAVCVSCCGLHGSTPEDPGQTEDTRSWHTIYRLHEKDSGDLQREIELHKANVQAKHEAAIRAKQHASTLVLQDAAQLQRVRQARRKGNEQSTTL